MPAPLNRFIAAGYKNALHNSLPMLIRRMDAVADGRATPSLDAMPIGSGRKVRAVVTFFDIRGFTALTCSDDPQTLKRTLLLLNCVIPAMMRVLYRYGAYVEKNTGDGLMAISGVENQDNRAANDALNAAQEMFWVLRTIVNPAMAHNELPLIDARIGIDMGQILISRIGLPNGSADHPRNALTAVGPAANRACKLQGMAGTNEIWCGDALHHAASPDRLHLFDCVTPPDWTWLYGGNPQAPYHCWKYRGVTADPDLGIRVRVI